MTTKVFRKKINKMLADIKNQRSITQVAVNRIYAESERLKERLKKAGNYPAEITKAVDNFRKNNGAPETYGPVKSFLQEIKVLLNALKGINRKKRSEK